MNDLISRQTAIRRYQEVCKGIKCGECSLLIKVNTEKGSHLITDCKLEAFLHDLPSAQPEPTLEQIEEYCRKRCLVIMTSELYNYMTSMFSSAQPEPCKDAVSRAEIIRLILERGLYCDTQADRKTSAEIIRQLPSAQPERPKGKWNTYYHSDTEFTYSCNSCGYSAPYQVLGGEVVQKKWNFCPNCGADMRGENHENTKMANQAEMQRP